MSHPKVFIVVLNWNGKEDTLACLESLRSVSYTCSEVLMVDNASSDGTVESVRSKFPSVKVITNQANLRFAGGSSTWQKGWMGRSKVLFPLRLKLLPLSGSAWQFTVPSRESGSARSCTGLPRKWSLTDGSSIRRREYSLKLKANRYGRPKDLLLQ